MTVLTTIQGAAAYLGISIPTFVTGSTEREHVELTEIANEAAQDIAEYHDWQSLKNLARIDGDGVTSSFALPSNYDRMPKKQSLWSTTQESPLTHVQSHDDWLEIDIRDYGIVVGAWTLLGGNVEIKPTPDDGEFIKYYFQSRDIITTTLSDKTKITLDADSFDIFPKSERVLKLAIIWRWRALKGLDYAEDLNNYETALGLAAMRDGGSKMLVSGNARSSGIRTAYPQAIIP